MSLEPPEFLIATVPTAQEAARARRSVHSRTHELPFSLSRVSWMVGAAVGMISFLLSGLLYLPLLGLETDELLFAQGIIAPQTGVASISIGDRHFSWMIGSYIGGLKSWLWAPLSNVFGYTVFSVRLPALILSLATLLLLGRLLMKLCGARAALIVVWLLGTDITFLTTGVFDWGTVVLQNLLLVSGLVLFETWSRRRRDWLLLAVGLLFGLALWDKAIFIWNLAAMLCALAVLRCCSLIRLEIGFKSIAALLVGLFAGAFPLVCYNYTHQLTTVSQNAHFSTGELKRKFDFLLATVDGQTPAGFFPDFTRSAPIQSTGRSPIFFANGEAPAYECSRRGGCGFFCRRPPWAFSRQTESSADGFSSASSQPLFVVSFSDYDQRGSIVSSLRADLAFSIHCSCRRDRFDRPQGSPFRDARRVASTWAIRISRADANHFHVFEIPCGV